MRHLNPTSIQFLLITLLFVCAFSCTTTPVSNEPEEEQATTIQVVAEETNTNPYMLYKLYKERSKGLSDQPVGLELFDDFNEIYKANDVKVIGVWQNNEDPNELYFMTAFRDEEHYQSFVASVREDSVYQEMSKKIEEDRESIESTTLTKLKP
jgi:hypothetical protein